MELFKLTLLAFSILFGICHLVLSDGQRDFGEECSLRSQIANFFRPSDSPNGCISSKGLVCLNHKCVCMDPSNIYETPEPTSSSDSGSTTSQIQSAASSFFKKLVGGSTTTSTTTIAPTTGATAGGGKCVGRAGSPCFTNNSTCVKHAVCEGSPLLICKCKGIYSSNTSGHCSKSASVVNQVIKQTIG